MVHGAPLEGNEVELTSGEIVVMLHQELATGEPGDPISADVQGIIRGLAELGYGVVDFGESQGNSIELWFTYAPTHAHNMAESFIRAGGDV